MPSTTLTMLNGRIRIDTKSQNLVLSPRPGGSEPCCCDDCKICFYFNDHDGCRDTTPGNIKYVHTIKIPSRFTLPVKVTAVGGVDDVFMLDGDGSVFGQNPARFGTPAHAIDYTWTQTEDEFTVAALDTYGGCTGLRFTICIMPLDTTPTKECEPLTVLPGSRPPGTTPLG